MPNRTRAVARTYRTSRLGRGRCSALWAATLGRFVLGCGSEIHGDGAARFADVGGAAPAVASPAPAEGAAAAESVAGSSTALDFGLADDAPGEVEVVCAARAAASELRRVSLAFVFDVSASMGGNDRNRYETKWLPVVAASEAFFATTDAASLSASLTFFPKPEASTRCTARA